jgi:NAD(P)H-dependent flavin oxidoreductase YrpB (nitropropane dioxygenase family)
VASLRTALCHLLGVDYPVLSAGIGAGARAELVGAVSHAGGFGVLGASGMPPDAIRAEIERIRTLTQRPFGINVIIAEDSGADLEEDRRFFLAQFRAAAEEGAAAIVLFWGDPAPFVEEAHAWGLDVLIQVGSVQEAEAAVAAGVDAVIAQGVEAGGHVRGTTSIWELVPMTAAAVSPVPVLASGGIGDGAGLARALTLGAQGVSLGTRFVASDEANVHPEYKRRIVSSVAADTVYTADLYDVWWPDAPHRTLRNRNFEEWHAAGRPPPGTRPGEGTFIGAGLPSPVRSWTGLAMQRGWRLRTSTETSTTPRSGQASRALSSTTSSRQARYFSSSFAMPRPRSPRPSSWRVLPAHTLNGGASSWFAHCQVPPTLRSPQCDAPRSSRVDERGTWKT